MTDNLLTLTSPLVEKHIIGSCLSNKNAFFMVKSLAADDFYDIRNKKMFCVMKTLFDGGDEITVATVIKQCGVMRLDGELSPSVILEYTASYETDSDLEKSASMLKEYSLRRKLMSEALNIQKRALDKGVPTDEIISGIQQNLDMLLDSSASVISPMSKLVDNVLTEIGNEESGISNNVMTGFHFMDEAGGLCPTDIVCIAAYPAIGKSALTAKMAYNIAMTGTPVAYYSLEMPTGQIIRRLSSTISSQMGAFDENSVPFDVCQAIANIPKRSPEQTKTMVAALKEIKQLPLYIADSKNTLDEITASIGEHVRQTKVKVVFIDYIQNIRNTTKLSREEFLGQCCSVFKATAKRYFITIVILTQLKQNQNKEDRRPHYYNAKGASSIFEASDVFLTLDRPEADNNGESISMGRQYEGEHSQVSIHGTAEIRICKKKNGMKESYILGFNAPYTDFFNMDVLPPNLYGGRRL